MNLSLPSSPPKTASRVRIYAFAIWYASAPSEARAIVSRSRSGRCHLDAIAGLMPSVGRRVDEAGLTLRAARYVAHGTRGEQSARLERVLAWLALTPEERRGRRVRWEGMSDEERAANPGRAPLKL